MASYGSEAGVAALCKRYTSSGSFSASTNPTLSSVSTWLAEISSMLNMALATNGFAVPVTDGDVTPALDGVVNNLVADLAHAANSAGRFYSERALENGVSPIKAIGKDVRAWVEESAAGLVAMGATRTTSDAGQAAFRDMDERGNATFPVFQRDGFSNSFINTDVS